MEDLKETGRVEAFSDGVFAVAITLLILDVAIPGASATKDLSGYLLGQWPMLLAFVASFFTIGVMWINHHKLFTHIKYIDNNLLLFNLLLLLIIVFIPYPTALIAEQYKNYPDGHLAAIVYSGTNIILAICFNLVWRYSAYHNRLLRKDADPQDIAAINRQYSLGPFIYLVVFGVAWINVPASILLNLLVAIFFALPQRTTRPPAEITESSGMAQITLREITDQDENWLIQFSRERWGASTVIAHGVRYELAKLPGFIAEDQNKCVGVITYHKEGKTCEIVSIDSLRPAQGIGTALLNAVKNVAQQADCTRLWLITTNDNLTALQFYQKRNFVLVSIHRNALEESRKLKPQIPLLGENGISLRDEIELEMLL